jgi:hypothetical protein
MPRMFSLHFTVKAGHGFSNDVHPKEDVQPYGKASYSYTFWTLTDPRFLASVGASAAASAWGGDNLGVL